MPRHSKLALLLAGLCGLLSPVQAQTSLPQVDISVQRSSLALPPRVDVSEVCPAIASQLAEHISLAYVYEPVESIVRFQLRDGEVSQLGLRRAPIELRDRIRRAMYQVSCRSDGQANQNFAFMLRMVPEGEGGAQAVALKADSPMLLALQAAD